MKERLTLSRIRAALRDLTLNQAKRLQSELEEIIRELEHQQDILTVKSSKKREVVEVHHVGNQIYQLERVRCGKPSCKCVGEQRELHGPYRYVYWCEDGKLRSRYIGKILNLKE